MSILEEARELIAMGMSMENIQEKLTLSKKQVSYVCSDYEKNPPKKYIKDEEKRKNEIQRLRDKGMDKTYKERGYLQYLLGNWTKDMYESIFYN